MKNLKNCKFVIMALSFFFFLSTLGCDQEETDISKTDHAIKILVLIIASDNDPLYIELQKMWRLYMHNDLEHVEAYFMKCDPNLPTEYMINGDVIWTRSIDNILPGLTNKTIISMDAFLHRIKTEFDYVLRPNLSSFYVFPRLLNFLKHCRRSNFYCGSDIGDPTIASGCGFLLSKDLVELLVTHKNYFLNNMLSYDDVVIGDFLRKRGIQLQPHKRTNFYSLGDRHANKDNIGEDVFHFRVKTNNRVVDDIYIHSQLLKIFYGQFSRI